jgi:hypothetical protein
MRALFGVLVIAAFTACTQGGVEPHTVAPIDHWSPRPEFLPEPKPEPEPQPEVPKPPELAASTALSPEPAGASRIAELQRLELGVSVVGAEGPHELAVEFITPSGDVYRRSAQPLSGSAFETQAVSFELLVSGTNIELGNMSGTWTARVLLDGTPLATRAFELAP